MSAIWKKLAAGGGGEASTPIDGGGFDGVAYLIKDFASATQSGNTKFTISFWVEIATEEGFSVVLNTGNAIFLFLGTDYTIQATSDASSYNNIETGDPGFTLPLTGVNYFLMSVDSTQANAVDRVKVWHGVYDGAVASVTLTVTDILQNATFTFNDTHVIQNYLDVIYFDGVMGGIHFLDGIAVTDPSPFVANYATTARPKTYTGSYGNLGYRLDFSNASIPEEDSSGNNNDFTESGTITQETPWI